MRILLCALNAHYSHTNLALRYIRAALADAGFPADFAEMHINLPHRAMLERIAAYRPELVGFSCYIWNIDQILRLCRSLKAACPGVRVALGGPEAAYRAREILDAHREVDYVLTGEGELSFPKLARTMPDRGVIDADGTLDPRAWPDPYADGARDLAGRIVYTETSRGCPFRCAFCLSSGDAVRALDVESSVKRLTALADDGVRLIKLVDRTFNFDRRRADAIWSALIAHAEATGFTPTYHFEISAQLLDEENFRTLARAPKGLFQVEIGIQSSFDRTLNAVDRHVSFDELRRAVLRVRALDTIHTHVDLIAGLPYEDFGRFGQSFDDVYALGADQLQMGFLKMLHGSPLRRRAAALGMTFEPDAPYEILATPDLPFADMCALKDIERLLTWYVNSGRYSASIRLLTKESGLFSVLRDMASAMRRDGVFDAERGEKARAAFLARYGAADREALRCAVTHDLLSRGLRRELPDDMAFVESEEDRKLLRARFAPARGKTLKRCAFDIAALERGDIRTKQTVVVYDADGAWREI